MALQLSQVYIDTIKEFKTECNTLIGNFTNGNSNDFKDFLLHWKSLKFNLIYEKCSNKIIYDDYKEDTLEIAKYIMLSDNFVGGMYLLYGLHYIQSSPKSYIRLQLEEFLKVMKILRTESKSDIKIRKHPVIHQAGFFFTKLLKYDAFYFTRFSREFDMEGQNRARMIHNREESFFDERRRVKPKEWLTKILQETGCSEEIKDVENEYLKKKLKIKQEFPELNVSLDMVQHDIISLLVRSLTQADKMVSAGDVDDSIGARRRELKNRRIKIKHKYKEENSDEDSPPYNPPPKAGRKRGCPKGQRKFYFTKAINDPEVSSDTDVDSSQDEPISDNTTLSLPYIP